VKDYLSLGEDAEHEGIGITVHPSLGPGVTMCLSFLRRQSALPVSISQPSAVPDGIRFQKLAFSLVKQHINEFFSHPPHPFILDDISVAMAL
jgi:hypothetical protein